MNAFTKKPDTSWVKQLQRDAKSGKAASSRMARPTEAQRKYMSIKTPRANDMNIQRVPSEDTEGGEI